MRTKALLCAAGLLAVGAVSTMAQSNVYSLNVVGYINVPLTNGFQLIANQMDLDGNRTNNTVQGVFSTNMPSGTKVFAFSTSGGYSTATYLGTAWLGGVAGVNAGLSPGNGVWVQLPGASGTSITLTEVGNVVQGTTSLPISAGFQIMSIVPPLSAQIQTVMAFPPTSGDKVYQFSTTSGYTTRTYLGTSWLPSQPTPAVGEAFWLQTSGAKTWNQTFTVQ